MTCEYLVFNGKSSLDFETWISGTGTFDSPERDVENISVPGRSGDLIVDNKRFLNVSVTYPAFIVKDFKANFDALKAFLLAEPGYHRLEDSYHPEHFRLAQFKGAIRPDMRALNRSGSFDLVFDCKPQRYLKSGEKQISLAPGVNDPARIKNPTLYDAMPLLRIYGTGTLDIDGQSITITQADGYTDFDCDLMNAYKDTPAASRNQYVSTSTTESIVLKPGINNFILTASGITSVIVAPRWYTI